MIQENTKNDFRHFYLRRQKPTYCLKCLRRLEKSTLVKAKVVDGVLRTNALYCPSGTKHIDSVSTYRQYLKEELGIKDFALINKKVHEWELYRIKKGYLTIPEISKVTKAHKEAWRSVLEYRKVKKQKELAKVRAKQKAELQEIIDDLIKLENILEEE
tara:strand:- start:4842 stop:5315 length:474 start_codon:yes stop_codon:yes gene_type:complete